MSKSETNYQSPGNGAVFGVRTDIPTAGRSGMSWSGDQLKGSQWWNTLPFWFNRDFVFIDIATPVILNPEMTCNEIPKIKYSYDKLQPVVKEGDI